MMLPSKVLRRFPLLLSAITIGVVSFATRKFYDFDLVGAFIESLGKVEHLEAGEGLFLFVLIIIGLAIDQTRNARFQRAKSTGRKGRIQAVRSTMAAVHDIVNNALNNLVLIRLEAEKSKALSPETLALFEDLIDDTAKKLREIDELESIAERTLSPGLFRLDVDGSMQQSVKAA